MALDGRTDSGSVSYRSLHWAPLRSWNLFSGRVRSRLPEEPPPAQLPHSRSLRNCSGEGSRVGTATSRGAGRVRSSESQRKGVDLSRRDHNQRTREGGHRQGSVFTTDDPLPLYSGAISAGSESINRRRVSQDRALDASDYAFTRSNRPSATIAHHQQHHHHQQHDHHHHHYHYHHLYHQLPRRHNEHQDQAARMPTTTSAGGGSSSHLGRRNGDRRRSSANRRSSITTNSRVASNTRSAAIEARDRLAERLRGAALLSHRHSNAGYPGGFLDEFSLLFDDEDDAWSDDEVWELGIQDWLVAWGYEEGWQADMLSSAEPFTISKGLTKSMIRNLHKEVFVPKGRRKDKEVGDTSLEQDDCSVCLEHFLAGQLLIHLPCKHRFHPDCLTPWLEMHGQCPYCRARIGNEAVGEASSSGGTVATIVPSSDEDLVAWMGLTIN